MNAPNIFVTTLERKQAEQLLADLKSKDFEITIPPHTLFSAKKTGLSCTVYSSGKCVVQGKETSSFVEFYLEPELLGTFESQYPELSLDTTPRIGIDESGKGDFFGPLCIAGLYAGGKEIENLKKMGVKDSKTLTDKTISKLAHQIRNECVHHIIRINPEKYNQLHTQFGNLNSLLAWGHATAIEQLVEKTGCKNVIIDQFANEYVVIKALSRKSLNVNLTQRHRAEEDLVVAGASILARATFVDSLAKLEEEYGINFPKGASPKVIQTGKQLLARYGKEIFTKTAKMHFKTLDSIL